MTFYQHLKEIMKQEIEEVTGRQVNVWNDVTDELIEDAPGEEINLVIKTGVGTTSKIQGLNYTSYPINIIGICEQNLLQEILDDLDHYVDSVNGTVKSEKTFYYALAFEKPTVMSVDKTAFGQAGEEKVAIFSLLGTGTISEENIQSASFKVNDLDILPINYTDSFSVNISTIQEIGFNIDDVSYEGSSRIWNIAFFKQNNVNLNVYTLFYEIVKNRAKMKLKLKKNGEEYTCVLTSWSEVLDKSIGLPIITVSLLECRE